MNIKAPKNINKKAQFLAGIGASAWFYIYKEKSRYIIERYSEDGKLECSRLFRLVNTGFDINRPYNFTYLSNCKKCTIIQDKIKYKFSAIIYEN